MRDLFMFKSFGGTGGIAVSMADYDANVKAIAHRGYSVDAPENTIPAYILAKQKGFKYVECDVAFTSDGVPVLLHDRTIDRTSNGSGNISNLTYKQANQFDYGIWKSAEYAGTHLPTLDEFLRTCKGLGLHPYIEIKNDVTYSKAQIESIVESVKKTGMKGKVTYISFNATYLGYVKAADPYARLGYTFFDITSEALTMASSLKLDTNEVFVDVAYTYITDAKVDLCIAADLPLEVWSMNDEVWIEEMNPYISGVTSDSLIAGKVLHDKYSIYNTQDSEYEVVRTLASSNLVYGKATSYTGYESTPPYTATHEGRAGYLYQDILVEYGYVYRFDFESTQPNAQIGTQFLSQQSLEFMANKEYCNPKYIYDPGWQENGVEIAVPEKINGSPIACVRLSFRMSPDNEPVEYGFIKRVTITRKPLESLETVRTLNSSDIVYGRASLYSDPSGTPPYTTEAVARAGYFYEDIPVEYGYVYRFDFESTQPNAQTGLQFLSQQALELMANKEVCNSKYVYDPGWQANGVEITVPETVSDSPIACVRITFRMSPNNEPVEEGFIKRVTITRRPVA